MQQKKWYNYKRRIVLMEKEALARIKINKLLEESGWRFFDNENGTANIELEPDVKIKEQDIDELGIDFEKTKDGFVDYLLLDEDRKPFIVVEAKKESIHALFLEFRKR